MRCVACNRELTDYEATIRSAATDQFEDMCLDCLRSIADDVVVYSLHTETDESTTSED